jgi:hypothetical protein
MHVMHVNIYYLESGQSKKLSHLSSGSMSIKGSLKETPVPELENNFRRPSINAKHFPCKPTRESRSESFVRRFKGLFFCFVVLELLWQRALQQGIVAPNPKSFFPEQPLSSCTTCNSYITTLMSVTASGMHTCRKERCMINLKP